MPFVFHLLTRASTNALLNFASREAHHEENNIPGKKINTHLETYKID
jgi:hypothetical protein